MFQELSTIGIELNENKENLLKEFSSFFLEYNNKVNLISKNDSKLLFEKHIFDSLALNLFLKKYKIASSKKVLDIGTGGGFPSLPCSIIFDDLSYMCIDSINKKINFIKEASSKLALNNITPICIRAEDLESKYRNSFDVVISRAMAELRIILEYAIPYAKVGGYFVSYKAIKAEEEIENALNALKKLNAVIVDKIEYNLPLNDNNKRVLIIVRKEKTTSSDFPRSNQLIKKNPL